MQKFFNVLFLCPCNSARSIMAEAILGRLADSKFRAFSAGARPKAEINRYALATLNNAGFETADFRPKSWTEFASPQAPALDFIFTVCDAAAPDSPCWRGQPIAAHWDVPDPAAVEGPEALKHLAFADAFRTLGNRISVFVALPMNSLDALLQRSRQEAAFSEAGLAPSREVV